MRLFSSRTSWVGCRASHRSPPPNGAHASLPLERDSQKANLKRVVDNVKQAAVTSGYEDSNSRKTPLQNIPIEQHQGTEHKAQTAAASSRHSPAEEVQTFADLERQIVMEQLRKRGGTASSTEPKHIKQYPPVSKGGLLLPGGPNWSAFRRHMSYTETPGLPSINAILVVEGDNDYAAVSRAVNVPAYVFDGTRLNTPAVNFEAAALKVLGRPVIVATDPDAAGRQFRMQLDDLIGPLYHAFLPEASAVTVEGTMTKEAGNRGLEHASPESIQAALSSTLLSYGPQRQEFTREELQQLQLLNDENFRVANVELRRRLLCALLGVGDCRGGALQTVLNRFISREQLSDTLAEADRRLAAMGITLGGVTVLKSDEHDMRLLQALA